jgi:glutathione synthase/RimK-type ligase-like ATP-grasp enzyme
MILVVTFPDNAHVQRVLEFVNRPVSVFDVADFPSRARIEARFGPGGERLALVTVDGTTIEVAEVGAVWFRRVRAMDLDPDLMDETSRLFAWSESTEALTGLWHAMECFWMNPPAADEAGQRKIRQLQLARQVGLSVPETMITNDPGQALAFVSRYPDGGVIRKAFRNIPQAPRSTAVVTPDDRTRIDDVRYAPVIFQEFVPAVVDLRVIVVEDELFAVAIRSTPEYQTDYRMGIGSAQFTPYTLPDDVATRLIELHRRFGLAYGASDFRVTPDGEHVFLEVNPAGEYLFASERTGQPVPQAIAAALERHDNAHEG